MNGHLIGKQDVLKRLMEVIVTKNYAEMSALAARMIEQQLASRPHAQMVANAPNSMYQEMGMPY